MPKYLVHAIVENASTKAQYHDSAIFEVERMDTDAIYKLNDDITASLPHGFSGFVVAFFKLD